MQQKVFSDWFLALPQVIDNFARFTSAKLWNAPYNENSGHVQSTVQYRFYADFLNYQKVA